MKPTEEGSAVAVPRFRSSAGGRAPRRSAMLGTVAAQPPTGRVTMLFTDIEGSTQLARLLGDDWPSVLAHHHDMVGGAITAEGGYIDGTEGDSFFAVFEDPEAAVAA